MAMKTLLLALLFCLNLSASTEPIRIGLMPGADPKATEKQSYILAEQMQNRLGQPVQINISQNYSGIIEALKAKKIDFAVLTSMTFVAAEKELALKVLLKKTWNSKPFYYAALVTKNSKKIKNLADLKGRSIAFVDEKSASGFMYPQLQLNKNKVQISDYKKVVYSGNHAASVELLDRGQVDVIAVFADDEKGATGAWSRYGSDNKKRYKTLWVSEPIPNDPVVVRQDYYDQKTKLTHEVMYTLIELQNENQQQLGEVLGTSDLMPATSRQYDVVREVYKLFKDKTGL